MNETERVGVSRVQLIVYEKLHWIFREQPIDDCGIDAHIELKGDSYAEGKLIAVQIKSGESYFKRQQNNKIVYRADEKHLIYWASSVLPVIIVLYNPRTKECIWDYTGKVSSNKQICIDRSHRFDEYAKDELIRIASLEPYKIAQNNRKKYIENQPTWFFKKGFEKSSKRHGLETPVAIDFGSTKTMIGFIDEHAQITIVKSDEGKNYIDTVVGFDENYQYYIGADALRRKGDTSFIIVRNFKRELGGGKKYQVHGLTFSAEDITTLFIGTVIDYVEARYGINVEKCWISQPVDFLYSQKAYEQCIKKCNLTIVKAFKEPSCVSINNTVTGRNEMDIIFDMGGGTFDAVLCINESGIIEILKGVGDRTIGGIDYDEMLAEAIKEKLIKKFPDILINYVLKNQIDAKAEEIKIILSTKEMATVVFTECYLENQCELTTCWLEISRNEFREMTKPLNIRVENVIKEMAEKYWTLHGSDFYEYAANSLILLGGQGAKIFTIQELIKKWFPKIPIVGTYSDRAVIEGLTRYLGKMNGISKFKQFLLLDILYFNLLLTGKKLYFKTENNQDDIESEIVLYQKDDLMCSRNTIQFKIDCDQEISIIMEYGKQRYILRKYYLKGNKNRTIYNITIVLNEDRTITGFITGKNEDIILYEFMF